MSIDREPHDESVDSARGVLCAECEHLNPPGTQVCGECRAELFVVCGSCGRRNERIYSRCAGCRGPLRQPRWGQWLKRLFGKSRWVCLVASGMRALNFFAAWSVSEAVTKLVLSAS